jgi:hypothetical protein
MSECDAKGRETESTLTDPAVGALATSDQKDFSCCSCDGDCAAHNTRTRSAFCAHFFVGERRGDGGSVQEACMGYTGYVTRAVGARERLVGRSGSLEGSGGRWERNSGYICGPERPARLTRGRGGLVSVKGKILLPLTSILDERAYSSGDHRHSSRQISNTYYWSLVL